MPKAAILTTAAVMRLKPGDRRREVPDGGMRGLYLLIHPTGAKSWVMRYHRPNSTTATVKLTLGTADLSGKEGEGEPAIGGHLTLAAARSLAAEVQRQRALGRDPAAEVRAKKEARREVRNFGDAARTFIEEHARPKTRRWKETARILGLRPDDLGLVRGGLAYRWRDRPVDTITSDDIFAAVDGARRRAAPGQLHRNGASEARARHMASALSVMFGWLASHRIIKANPSAGMHRPGGPAARDRVLTDDEVRWLWKACDDVGEPFGSLIKVLLITGARREEAAGMTRSEMDGTTWTIPGLRTKNHRPHTVPLPALAQEAIGRMKIIAGEAGYVFTTTGRSPVSGFSRIKARLDKAMLAAARTDAAENGGDPAQVSIAAWRLHDLRRTAATGMARAGADLHVIERALNHVSGSFGGIVGVYQPHKFEKEVRAALEAWANLLRAIVGKLPPNVVPLSAAADRNQSQPPTSLVAASEG